MNRYCQLILYDWPKEIVNLMVEYLVPEWCVEECSDEVTLAFNNSSAEINSHNGLRPISCHPLMNVGNGLKEWKLHIHIIPLRLYYKITFVGIIVGDTFPHKNKDFVSLSYSKIALFFTTNEIVINKIYHNTILIGIRFFKKNYDITRVNVQCNLISKNSTFIKIRLNEQTYEKHINGVDNISNARPIVCGNNIKVEFL